MFGLGALIQVGMLIAGCWWCREIFGRFRSDVVEFKSGDWTQRSVVMLICAVTGVVLYLICSFVLRVATAEAHRAAVGGAAPLPMRELDGPLHSE